MKKTFFRVVALTAALSLATMNMAFAGGSIGHGNISVYKEDTLVSKLSGQNPIEDGALLVCDGKCMLKSEGISVIAEDKIQDIKWYQKKPHNILFNNLRKSIYNKNELNFNGVFYVFF